MQADDIAVRDPDRFEVWPENWPTLELFDRLGTQWRWDGMSGRCLGLNYGGVETLLRLEGVADQARVFADLQVMERAALAVMNRGKAA